MQLDDNTGNKNGNGFLCRIMGKHVNTIVERVRNSTIANPAQGLCPFTTALLEEDRSMFEILMQDDRVTNELAVNMIMALFRTGIDSVRAHSIT